MCDVISQPARAHLRWALVDGVGPLLFSRMCERFGDAQRALAASASELVALPRVSNRSADTFAAQRDAVNIEREIETAATFGVRIICREDEAWPAGLRRIPDPPIVLYVKGELRATDAVALAIVGSRRCSIYGSEQARRFGELLAGAGYTVVSGLARGIDAFAHHGAVDSGGRSVAVFGRDLSDVYPAENRALAERILDCGAWISEYPFGTAVRGGNFPSRNRIIAGMTLGTLVVEAAKRSGALITARLASEYNREVFAVPGRAQDPTSLGANALIRDGAAKLTIGLEDIVDELGDVGVAMHPESGPLASKSERAGSTRASDTAQLTDAERSVFEKISSEPVLQDLVSQRSERPPGEVMAALTSLELKGLIRRLPGNLVQRR